MRNLILLLICLVCLPAFAAMQGQGGSAGGTAIADNCFLTLLDRVGEAQVPAQEAGVLLNINVREGQQVPQGTILAQIDDTQAKNMLVAAGAESKAAREKAVNDIDIRHSKAAAEVAKFDYLGSVEANRKVKGAVSEVDVQQKKFQWDRAVLAIEQAEKEQVISGFTAEAKKAEHDNAQEGINRRQIVAPIEGIVEKSFAHIGEWVKAGDPVVRIVRLDRLQVDAHLNAREYNPAEVIDQPVVVTVELARGRKLQVPGHVVFVQSEIQGGNIYAVRAEVENRKENGQWLLRPGMEASMAIQLR
jgi:macrolide-specific efflux system membrane fusion protein